VIALQSFITNIDIDLLMENSPAAPMVEPMISTIHLPVHWSQSDIEQLLNNQLTGVLYEDTNLADDGLQIKATKSRNIKLRLDGLTATYRVPLDLWIFKKLLDSRWTGVRGIELDGEVNLSFKTVLNVQPDWTIVPQTELIGYEWLRNMAVKTGIGQLDVKYIANLVIDRTKTDITKGIDIAIRQSVDLPPKLNQLWAQLQHPIKVNEEYHFWLQLMPQTIEITPLSASGDELTAMLSTTVLTQAGMNQTLPPPNTEMKLPNFIPSKDTFQVGGQALQISALKLQAQGEQLLINADFTGSYSGSLFLTGKPAFDSATNTLHLQELRYELSSKNFLFRSALWLFEGVIAKKLKEYTVFPLGGKLTEIKSMINDKLQNYVLNNYATLNGQAEQLTIKKFIITSTGVKTQVQAIGRLAVTISGLGGY
jgi:hypothetical protein